MDLATNARKCNHKADIDPRQQGDLMNTAVFRFAFYGKFQC
jgi:hypothetical protein